MNYRNHDDVILIGLEMLNSILIQTRVGSISLLPMRDYLWRMKKTVVN
jgi:hypothetical protein